MKFLDNLLSKLPFDGEKTQIGTALLALPLAWPEVYAASKAVVLAAGGFITAIGLLHKVIKKFVR